LIHPAGGVFATIAAVENAALLALFLLVFLFRRERASIDRPLLLFCIMYVLLLSFVIGITTPVMGAVVRYRTPMLPFLMIAALLVLDERKLMARWKWTRALFT
jgi:uncharacterized membrane protein